MDTGAAAVLALAAYHPDMVESLTLVTGFWPAYLHDLSTLDEIPDIRIYVGENDELHQCEALLQLVDEMDHFGVHCHMQVIPGAGHFSSISTSICSSSGTGSRIHDASHLNSGLLSETERPMKGRACKHAVWSNQ